MSNHLLEALLRGTRRRVFISYHHNSDQEYYDTFSRAFSAGYEAVQDNSLERIIDSGDSDYVIRRIREKHITGTSCTIVLCGPQTRWRKYVDWEIKATLDKRHGLIGIKLPNNPCSFLGGVHKPDRLQDNIDSGYALFDTWENLLRGPDYLRALVELANARSPLLIVNNRPLRGRNG